MLGGVAAGLAQHLGLPVRVVRFALAGSVPVGGFGLVLYAWLWALAPESAGGAEAEPPSPERSQPQSSPQSAQQNRPQPRPARWRSALGSVDLPIGALLLAAGVAVLASRSGLPVQARVVVPLLVVLAGTVLAFRQLDEVDRSRWTRRAGVGRRTALVQVSAGLVLVVVGVLLLVVRGVDPGLLGRTLAATAAVLGGVVLVLGPWAVRLWRSLDLERAARAREAERADIAAHLHDSVLQTLTLIQRRSTDPGEVARLARAQERDLRSWLYAGDHVDPSTLAARVAEAAAQIEDTHSALVEVVQVGDRDVDARVAALLGALREALMNAARHAGGPVRVYVECGPRGVEAFVRDRGPGFDLAGVPADRHGVRESILARMERAGGSAELRSTPGEGTEVRLSLPDGVEEAAR